MNETDPEDIVAADSQATAISAESQASDPSPLINPSLSSQVDELIITSKGSAPQFQRLDKAMLTIGREASNDIALNNKAISRQHAQLEQRDGQWYVTDLASTNGTFLAKEQLAANVEHSWQAGHPVQVGPFTLQWQSLCDLTKGQTLVLMPGEYEPLAEMIETIVDDTLDVSLDQPQVTVELGDSAEIKVSVLNQAIVDKQLAISVIGIPEHWVELPPYAITALSNKQCSFLVKITIPQSTLVAADEYAYEVILRDQDHQAHLTRLIGKIVVAPAHNFSLRLHQTPTANSVAIRLNVKNLGNISSTYRFQSEMADGFNIEGKQWAIALTAGLSMELNFWVSAEKRPLFGQVKQQPFSLLVEDEAGIHKQVDGKIEVTPHISLWRGLLMLIAFTLLLIAVTLLLG